MTHKPSKPILLNIPEPMLDQLDLAAKALRMTRSELIRRSLQRDMEFLLGHEVTQARDSNEAIAAQFRSWAKYWASSHKQKE